MNKLAGLLLTALAVSACGSRTPEPAADQYETATAERRPLVLVVEAAGVIEPIRTVELKSKASGEILELGADTGDTVAAGARLVHIDPRIPRNRLDQALAQQNAAKAKLLYDVLDASGGFYAGHARPDCRSDMNVTFRLPDELLEKEFVKAAAGHGLMDLKGHRSVGGIRASIYNAMPVEGVTALRDFMVDFQQARRA